MVQKTSWKDIAELGGIAAIVASLVFLGFQMRQTQVIALVDSSWNRALSEYESRSIIYEFPEVWAKGNAAANLTPIEAEIYSHMIQNQNTHAFYAYFNARQLGEETGADVVVHDLAGFLFENPGAQKEWNSIRDRFRRYREPFVGKAYLNAFEKAVRESLTELDSLSAQ